MSDEYPTWVRILWFVPVICVFILCALIEVVGVSAIASGHIADGIPVAILGAGMFWIPIQLWKLMSDV